MTPCAKLHQRYWEKPIFRGLFSRTSQAGVGELDDLRKGDTVIFDNPVGDIKSTRPHVRNEIRKSTFFSESQPKLTSAINRLSEGGAVSALGSQLLVAISENPETNNLSGFFTTHCFAYQGEDEGKTARRRIDMALKEILDIIVPDAYIEYEGNLQWHQTKLATARDLRDNAMDARVLRQTGQRPRRRRGVPPGLPRSAQRRTGRHRGL